MKDKCVLRVLCVETQKEFFIECGLPVENQPDPCVNCTVCHHNHEESHD